MFQITISGKNIAELKTNADAISALLGGTSAATIAALTPQEQARLRADATVVAPKEPTAAEKKAAKEAAKKAAEEAAKKAAEAEEESEVEEAEDDPLEDDAPSEGDEEEALTTEDVKKLLLEVKAKYPKDASLISEIVQKQGNAKKISEVKDEHLPAVAKRCRELLAKAKK